MLSSLPVVPLFSLFLVALASTSDATQIDGHPQALPVLLVSGANNHDWEWTVGSLEEILNESGLFAVTVSLDPQKDLANQELLNSMRAVMLDWNGPRWGDAAEEAFVQAVDGGLGVSVVHAADNAFEGWDAYESIVGHLWRDGTGHGSFHPFDVEMIDRNHPITAQFSDLIAHPDELYHRLVNTQGVKRRILAQAYSDPETGGTGKFEPMVMVGRFGAGRIFHTPLGHVWKGSLESRASQLDPQFRQLIVRGTEWAASGQVSDYDPDAGTVPGELAHMGWRSLFDGESMAGWRGLESSAFPSTGWQVKDRCLVHDAQAGGGDILTEEEFGEFELSFDFLLTPGANSGLKILIPSAGPAIGPEFQVLDDGAFKETETPKHLAGSIYDVVAAPLESKRLYPPGRWNHGRILHRNGLLEHWLNGRLMARIALDGEAWDSAVGQSKFKDQVGFGRKAKGHILLQDHGGEVWFRNLFVREFAPSFGQEIDLFNGEDLAEWKTYGDAIYEADQGSILGRIGGGGQSFLVSNDSFGDFHLEVDLRNEEPGNSGLQFRSHLNPNGRLFGYQMEIDPSDRSWSGGLYDEFRRGWLDDLTDNPDGRAAFTNGEWNHYIIEANGPWLRGWVNGVPTMDHVDPIDLEGQFALQVHSGNNTRMRWKNFLLERVPSGSLQTQKVTWGGPPGNSHCPLGRGDNHRHIFLDASIQGSGLYSFRAQPEALRAGIARTLVGGSLGMASGAPGFRSLYALQEGGILFDETLCFGVVELSEQESRDLSATFLDDRIVLHRGGTLVLDRTVPPSRWASSLQIFQCLEALPDETRAQVPSGNSTWLPY